MNRSSHHPRVTVHSVHGMVAAAHPLAAGAGAAILRSGGNAFDAAAATAAALGVVEPFMSGLAGMGNVTSYAARTGAVETLDFVPANPVALNIDGLLDRRALLAGARSCGAPANLAGWSALIEKYGTMSLAEVLAPAIRLARDGAPFGTFSAHEIEVTAPLIAAKGDFLHGQWLATYGIDGRLPATGEILKQPALARTFEAIASEGIGYLYGGPLGRALVERVRAEGGDLGMADLEAAAPQWYPALATPYRDLMVHVPCPPSEAFQYLLTLRLLDGVALDRLEHNGPEHLDIVFRAIRLAAGERIANNLVDRDRVGALLSEEALAPLHARLADSQPITGPTEQYVPATEAIPAQHTTSLSIADAWGNVVCLTQSLGSVFGCGVVLADYGVCLNNFLSFGDVHPDGTKRIRPGGPLALPLAPSVVTAGGRPVLALGTPGSYGIPQHQAQVLVRWKDFGFDLQAAIEEPRARLTDGRAILLENRFGSDVIRALEARGHAVEVGPAWTRKVGGMQGVAINPINGAFSGGADPRRDGYVVAP